MITRAKPESAKVSELLKDAEKYLWNGVGNYTTQTPLICRAIYLAATQSGGINEYPLDRLQSEIRSRLGGHGYYSTWAEAHKHLPGNWWLDSTQQWWPIIQANRLNWLRELQREFAEKDATDRAKLYMRLDREYWAHV